MPNLPDKIVNGPKKFLQTILFIVSGFMGLAGLAKDDGSRGGLIFLALIMFVVGLCIKTTHKYKGGTGIYK